MAERKGKGKEITQNVGSGPRLRLQLAFPAAKAKTDFYIMYPCMKFTSHNSREEVVVQCSVLKPRMIVGHLFDDNQTHLFVSIIKYFAR